MIKYGYRIWSKEPLVQTKNGDDLYGGQRSSGVKCGNQCAMATIFWSKKPLIQTKNDDLHGGQRSSEVKCGKQCAMATIFGQKNC